MVVGQSPLCLLVQHFKSGCSVEFSKGNSNMGKQVEVRQRKSSLVKFRSFRLKVNWCCELKWFMWFHLIHFNLIWLISFDLIWLIGSNLIKYLNLTLDPIWTCELMTDLHFDCVWVRSQIFLVVFLPVVIWLNIQCSVVWDRCLISSQSGGLMIKYRSYRTQIEHNQVKHLCVA